MFLALRAVQTQPANILRLPKFQLLVLLVNWLRASQGTWLVHNSLLSSFVGLKSFSCPNPGKPQS